MKLPNRDDPQLVLSLFPGIGLLDMAFEEEGFCVVRGPDLLWGGDIRRFYPPPNRFQGVIGGPPCQEFSPLRHLVKHHHGYTSKWGNLIPEFERVVIAAAPDWYLMENVPDAPAPNLGDTFTEFSEVLDNRWLGEEQRRSRRFSFGVHRSVWGASYDSDYPNGQPRANLSFETVALESAAVSGAVTSSDGGARTVQMRRYTLAEACRLQGLPTDFLAEAPFRKDGALKAVANGVPLPMGRAVARAVKRALGIEAVA